MALRGKESWVGGWEQGLRWGEVGWEPGEKGRDTKEVGNQPSGSKVVVVAVADCT